MGTMLVLMGSSRRAPAEPLPTGPRAAEIKRTSHERRFDSNTKQIIPAGMEQNKSERNLSAVIPARKPPLESGPATPRCRAGTVPGGLRAHEARRSESPGLLAVDPQSPPVQQSANSAREPG